jgi:hypothetical protein
MSSSDAVTSSTYPTEDGETKTKEMQYDFCQDVDQGAQLAAYDLADGRELGPWQIPCKPEFMVFRPGEAGTVKLSEILDDDGLADQLCVITGRTVDPATGSVLLVLETETTAKHAFALGQTGVAPPTPTIIAPEDLDEAVSGEIFPPVDPVSISLVEWTDKLVMRTDPIARAATYVWNFYDPADTSTPIRTIETTVPQVEYTKAQAHADGVRRDYKVDVAGRNAIGDSATPLLSSTVTNTAPAAPTSVVFADGTSTSTVTFTASVSGDALGYLVCWSTASGFDPMTQGALMSAGGSPAYTPQLPATTYYGKVGTFDLWSSQPDQINFSAQDTFVITPGSGGSPPAGDGGGGGFGGGGGHGGLNEF